MAALHVCGVGAIGGLLSWHLARWTPNTVHLLLAPAARRRARNATDGPAPETASIALERAGVTTHTHGFALDMIDVPAESRGQGRYERLRGTTRPPASVSPIDALFLTVKAPSASEALLAVQHRLSADSTVVLCQNGMGLLDQLLDHVFVDPDRRPSFVLAVTSHGARSKSSYPDLSVAWTGVGDLAFGIVPNSRVAGELGRREPAERPNAVLAGSGSVRLDVDLPAQPATRTLRLAIESLLACTPLQPRLLPLDLLQERQMSKLAVNCAINPITALLDVRNGALVGSNDTNALTASIASEASACFAAQLGRTTPWPEAHPLSATALAAYTAAVAQSTATNTSSMLGDVRRVAATEMCVRTPVPADEQRFHQRLRLAGRTAARRRNAGQRYTRPSDQAADRARHGGRGRTGANDVWHPDAASGAARAITRSLADEIGAVTYGRVLTGLGQRLPRLEVGDGRRGASLAI